MSASPPCTASPAASTSKVCRLPRLAEDVSRKERYAMTISTITSASSPAKARTKRREVCGTEVLIQNARRCTPGAELPPAVDSVRDRGDHGRADASGKH